MIRTDHYPLPTDHSQMALFSRKKEEVTDTKYEVSTDEKSGGITLAKVPSVLVQPRISEKAGHLVKLNKYVFKVKGNANKVEVKKAVEQTYKVKVTQVNIIRNLGKTKNFGNRSGITSGFKKAIVTLRKGDSIQGLTDVV